MYLKAIAICSFAKTSLDSSRRIENNPSPSSLTIAEALQISFWISGDVNLRFSGAFFSVTLSYILILLRNKRQKLKKVSLIAWNFRFIMPMKWKPLSQKITNAIYWCNQSHSIFSLVTKKFVSTNTRFQKESRIRGFITHLLADDNDNNRSTPITKESKDIQKIGLKA